MCHNFGLLCVLSCGQKEKSGEKENYSSILTHQKLDMELPLLLDSKQIRLSSLVLELPAMSN